jgi:hypothetical protein
MRDVIAKDLWDENQSAHAQVIDVGSGRDAATRVGTLLLTASLSTAVNAVKGLTREEMVECLIDPLHEGSAFLAAFDELAKAAWYLHHIDERFYFDRQENLTKLLGTLADEAPRNQIDELIRRQLVDMFQPTRKAAYDEVLPLPTLDEAAERLRHKRVLLIIDPDTRTPDDRLSAFFDNLTQKNNILVLTGDKTAMASLVKAARQHFAAQRANDRLPPGHPQRADLEQKQQAYQKDLTTTILTLFDVILYPHRRGDNPPQLVKKPLERARDGRERFEGEKQIEATLTADPLKLYLDVDKEFVAIRDAAERLLWPQNQDQARWSDVADRYAEVAAMFWLPPKGLDTLKATACRQELWEDLGNGYVSKKPAPKRTGVQVTAAPEIGDSGRVQLTVEPTNGGAAPRIHFAEDGPVTEQSRVLRERRFSTEALHVSFLVVDPGGKYDTGDVFTWPNTLTLRNELFDVDGERRVRLTVAPRGDIRFTLDATEPRNGSPYVEPFAIGDAATVVRAFAEADGLIAHCDFKFPARGNDAVVIDDAKPARLVTSAAPRRLDSAGPTFAALARATELGATFERVIVTVGQGARVLSLQVGDVPVTADFLKAFADDALAKIAGSGESVPVVMTFQRAHFGSGHDLRSFAQTASVTLRSGDVEQ